MGSPTSNLTDDPRGLDERRLTTSALASGNPINPSASKRKAPSAAHKASGNANGRVITPNAVIPAIAQVTVAASTRISFHHFEWLGTAAV